MTGRREQTLITQYVLNVLLCASTVLSTVGIGHASVLKRMTIDDISCEKIFEAPSLPQLQFHPDGRSYSFMHEVDEEVSDFVLVGIESQDTTILLPRAEFQYGDDTTHYSVESYRWSHDGKMILLETDKKQKWRRKSYAHTFVYNLRTQTITEVGPNEERIELARFSPDDSQISYVYQSNIYVMNIKTGLRQQLTSDGSDDILNGCFDWVYEEEFSIRQGYEWSPDSRMVAFWTQDQSNIKCIDLTNYDSLYQEIKEVKYPKAGKANSELAVSVVSIENGNIVQINLGDDADIYVPRIKWVPDSKSLLVERLNRSQDSLDMLVANPFDGQVEILFRESDSCWVDVHNDLYFEPSGEKLVWLSPRDGHYHAYRYDLSDKSVAQITSGEWEVLDIYGVDDEFLYFASNRGSLFDKFIERIKVDGSSQEYLTPDSGWHSATFTDDLSYFYDSYSRIDQAGRIDLFQNNGSLVSCLLIKEIPLLDEYILNFPERFSFITSDGIELNGFLMKPSDFDPSKKYPVIVYCYGGPGSQLVKNRWGGAGNYLRSMLAEEGRIVISVDGRGTTGRGKDFENSAFLEVGQYALGDIIGGLNHMAQYSWFDTSRVGIYGASFGGYVSALAITLGAEHFDVAVAVSSVIDWSLYDNVYTERYMRKPSDNTSGYESASVLTWTDSLNGDLLLVHGMYDDNVHVQNSMQLIKNLQEKHKKFDMMVYPSQRHGIKGEQGCHYAHMMFDYFMEKL